MRATDKHIRGFSLLELLISMAVTVVAVLAAVGLITKFARSAASFTEVSIMEESRGAAQSLLRTDLDNAGHNLTRPSPALAGTIFATPNSGEDYTWSNGTITKKASSGWDHGAMIGITVSERKLHGAGVTGGGAVGGC